MLREWQYDGAPVQLHPGDLGWYWRFGAEATAAAVRTWSRDGQSLAVGLLDGPGLLRLAIAPDAQHDEVLARQMVADVTQPERGVLPQGTVYIEARFGAAFQGLLLDDGWDADEPWTPLARDLARTIERIVTMATTATTLAPSATRLTSTAGLPRPACWRLRPGTRSAPDVRADGHNATGQTGVEWAA